MPWTDQGLPFSGSLSASRHSSYTGALRAAEHRGRQTLAYLALLQARGPMTDSEAALHLNCGLSTICSVRNGVRDQIVSCGFETHAFQSGRATKRTKWGVKS